MRFGRIETYAAGLVLLAGCASIGGEARLFDPIYNDVAEAFCGDKDLSAYEDFIEERFFAEPGLDEGAALQAAASVLEAHGYAIESVSGSRRCVTSHPDYFDPRAREWVLGSSLTGAPPVISKKAAVRLREAGPNWRLAVLVLPRHRSSVAIAFAYDIKQEVSALARETLDRVDRADPEPQQAPQPSGAVLN